MSLVAYGSSDESSEDEGSESISDSNIDTTDKSSATEKPSSTKMCLPTPKYNEESPFIEGDSNTAKTNSNSNSEKIHFENLPKPKHAEEDDVIEEELDEVLTKKKIEIMKPEKTIKKDRVPVKITVPSLSEFKDLDEEDDQKSHRIMPSKKGTGLFALLPPPKMADTRNKTLLIPQVVTKKPANQNHTQQSIDSQPKKSSLVQAPKLTATKKPLLTTNYDSNSEDEDDTSTSGSSKGTMDFFSLSTPHTIPDIPVSKVSLTSDPKSTVNNTNFAQSTANDYAVQGCSMDTEQYGHISKETTLVSNIMNLPKEEILLKNKAEVGPKLPVPEQEYNVDKEGNVAFDDRAIEYLCGKRGVKRKNKEIEEANIIEINGEDIKPDEREWLVKALTEEPIQRPISAMGGVNSQSKKKHQITYLAQQAKAMEMELKNQWAVNRMTRKQTQSKYGF